MTLCASVDVATAEYAMSQARTACSKSGYSGALAGTGYYLFPR